MSAACAEERPPTERWGRLSDRRRRPVSESSKRVLPLDLGEVDDATARQLLEQHRPIINTAIKRYLAASSVAFHTIPRDDLRAIAEAAVLEAFVRYREGDQSRDNGGGGLATWVRRVVGWRVGEVVRNALACEPLQSERAESPRSPNADPNGASPQHQLPRQFHYEPQQAEVVQARQLVGWLRHRLRSLTPRRRVIIVSVLKGEQKCSIARSLGISPGRVSQEYKVAVERLRELALQDGIDYLGLES